MIRECLGNKGIEKVFRFDAITCDKIQIRSMNFLHVVPPETIVRDQNYSGLCQHDFLINRGEGVRLGRNKNNTNMCNRSSLIMANFWNGTAINFSFQPRLQVLDF